MRSIYIYSVPHQDHRKEAGKTIGDYYAQGGEDHIVVSQMQDKRYELLVVIHELIEKVLCDAEGITEQQVDEFDKDFKGEGEPGDSPASPYYHQHQIATIIERIVALELNVGWEEYAKAIDSLFG
jgi:hypothetical protein